MAKFKVIFKVPNRGKNNLLCSTKAWGKTTGAITPGFKLKLKHIIDYKKG